MTSNERVMAAFEHCAPDRVPAWCGSSPEFWEKAKQSTGLQDEELRVRMGDDFRRVFAANAEPVVPVSSGSTSRTIFGVERDGVGYGQPLSHPLAKATIAEVHAYPWPDPKCMDVSHIRQEAEGFKGQYAILGGDWSPFFHDAVDLLGMELLFLKMYDEPELVDAVLQHIVDFYAGVSQRIFDAAASALDIFFIGNDFGTQHGPVMSPDLFRRFIFPHLQRLVRLGHDYKLKVMLHCCGGYVPLIPQMIEAGLDGLHALQPACKGMDLATLKRSFGDKILFNGAIDSQHVLIEGTPEFVREETRKVLEIMKTGGGYVAGASHDYILDETPVENVLAMFDAIAEFGRYN
jgi:uroporphyrinogen-III decarboxylase